MPTKLFTSKATYPNNIVIPPVALRHPAYYIEFVKVHGSHTGEVLAEAVLKVLEELKIKHKLFAITGNNAGNNGTLCQALYSALKLKFNNMFSLISCLRMCFYGKLS